MKLFTNTKYITASFLFLAGSVFTSCVEDDDGNEPQQFSGEYTATVNLAQEVNGVALQMNTRDYPYTNALSQDYNVTKLQYLISNIRLTNANGNVVQEIGYHYVDLDNPSSLSFQLSNKIPAGQYTSMSFTFGFNEAENISGEYTDLNTVSWNWPDMLGGGYHFMRLEGSYVSNSDTAEFKTHMGTARDNSVSPPTFTVNHFDVTIPVSLTITQDFSVGLVMNIDQWYTNPDNWDFDVWNAPVMPIYDAQRTLNRNGPSVFSIR